MNPRPLRSERSALAKLRYAPPYEFICAIPQSLIPNGWRGPRESNPAFLRFKQASSHPDPSPGRCRLSSLVCGAHGRSRTGLLHRDRVAAPRLRLRGLRVLLRLETAEGFAPPWTALQAAASLLGHAVFASLHGVACGSRTRSSSFTSLRAPGTLTPPSHAAGRAGRNRTFSGCVSDNRAAVTPPPAATSAPFARTILRPGRP